MLCFPISAPNKITLPFSLGERIRCTAGDPEASADSAKTNQGQNHKEFKQQVLWWTKEHFRDTSHAMPLRSNITLQAQSILWRLHRALLSWNGTTAFHPIKAKGFQSALYTWMNNSLQAWPARTAPSPAHQAGLQSAHKLVSVPLQGSLPQALERAIVPAWVSTKAQEPPREHNSLDLASTANFSTAHQQECCSTPCYRTGSINPMPWDMWEGACGAGRYKCIPLFLVICSQNTQTGNARRNSGFVMERKI